MNTKIYRAKTAKQALALIGREIGPDADIITSNYVKDDSGNSGVEITVAVPGEMPVQGKRFDLRTLIFIASGLVVIGVLIIIFISFPWNGGKVTHFSVDKPLIAVLYFENGTGNNELDIWQANIAHLLTTDLANSKFVNVVSSPRITNIITELGYVQAQSFPYELLSEISVRTGATFVVTGRFMAAKETFSLTMQLHATATGTVIATERFKGKGEDSIYAMVDAMTIKIKEQLGFNQEQIASDIDAMIEKMSTSSDEAMDLWREAIQYFWKSDFDAAIPILLKAIEIDPEFALAYGTISNVYGTSGRNAQSYEWALKALERSDGSSIWEQQMIKATVYFQSAKTIDKAIEALKESLQVYRVDFWNLFHIGMLNGQLENWEVAAEYMVKAYREKPEAEWIGNLAILARAYEALGDVEKEEECLQLMKETYPDDPRSYGVRFWHYIRRNDLQQAEIEAARAIELGTSNGTRHYRPLLAYYVGDYAEAERLFESYISNDSLSAQSFSRRGIVNIDVLFGRINKALVHYQPLIVMKEQLERSPAVTHFNFARLHALLGNYGQAIECLDRGLNYLDSLPALTQYRYRNMLLALALKGEYQLGMERIDLALETAGRLKQKISQQQNLKLMRFHNYLIGHIALQQRENKAAIREFRQALEFLSGQKYNSRILYHLAKAYFIDKDFDNSEKFFLNVLKHPQISFYDDDPNKIQAYFSADRPDLYVKSFYMLGKVYQAKGDSPKAVEYYREFLKFWDNADPELKEPEDARQQLALLTRNSP